MVRLARFLVCIEVGGPGSGVAWPCWDRFPCCGAGRGGRAAKTIIEGVRKNRVGGAINQGPAIVEAAINGINGGVDLGQAGTGGRLASKGAVSQFE